jgi:hypothetical protein
MTVLVDSPEAQTPTRTRGYTGQGRLRPPSRRAPVTAPRVVRSGAACHARTPRVPVGWLVILSLTVALAVVGLGALANAGPGGAPVPQETAVVHVGQGESLWQIAERAAPGSDTEAVVDRIRQLNGLNSGEVFPGQPLTVPVAG